MKLVRYEYPQYSQLADMDRFFEPTWSGVSRLGSLLEDWFDRRPSSGVPAMDWHEDDGHYYVQIELPGVKKDAIELDLENAVLSVRAERIHKNGEAEDRMVLARSVSVPEGVSADKIKAAFADGILTLTLPKADEVKPRRIQVE